ncbi:MULTISPECIES: MFS transporter [unclassified Streptomyces]|uniref:MFS transporter n=1 Tax=unclassified Streptomyces TaxID=2593676 RepID=UPI002ECFF735|nr:MFS transporter [Streptomyces sp. NBC_00891]WSY03751.1 MFS transporter [Streptomyces sp. NBC_00890]WSZ05377.1 MFS transporter [Streptomyces sp. NBC_00869]WSZ27127.1 MFS transporter [Streptomyces sp. NBC_00870]
MTTTAVRPRAALLASVAGAMIVALDGTVLLVAQPELRRDLGASVTQVQWTSTGYLLAVAALLVVAGRLGDRYGHRRLLCVGALGFGAASAGIGLARGIGWVIALRAAQGVFGALLQPATLALLRLVYPAERLGAAVAFRTSAIGVAAAAGPVLGGLLVTHWGWRAVFLINIPAALAIAALALAVRVPDVPRAAFRRFDLAAGALLAAALAVLVHTLAGIPDQGWTGTRTGLGLLLSLLLGAALIAYERRSAQPVVPPAVTRSVPVMASMALLLTTSGGLFGALFVVTFFLQQGLGLDPLACGLRCLPLTLLMIAGAPLASAALARHGPRRTAITGQICVVVAVLGLSRLSPAASWAETGPVFAVLGAGFTAVMVTATGTVVGDAPPGYAGVVGGLKQTAMNVGPTLGIAVAAGLMPLTAPAQSPLAVSGPVMGQALPAVAALAALGLVPASLLPRR